MKLIIFLFTFCAGLFANAMNVNSPLVSELKEDSDGVFHQFLIFQEPGFNGRRYTFVHFRDSCHHAETMGCSGTTSYSVEQDSLTRNLSYDLVRHESGDKITVRARIISDSEYVQEYVVTKDGVETVFSAL